MGYQSIYSGAQASQGIANGIAAGQVNGLVKSNGSNAFSAGVVNLATEITGVLPVANGGTGSATGFVMATDAEVQDIIDNY